jgi:hypothetical protein
LITKKAADGCQQSTQVVTISIPSNLPLSFAEANPMVDRIAETMSKAALGIGARQPSRSSEDG